MNEVLGIHHVTAVAGDPQRNVDFYAGLLGLPLVKRTVNHDGPPAYHLCYGDEVGRPGSVLTVLPWPAARRGRPGRGRVAAAAFAIPPGALAFWGERLSRHHVRHEGPWTRGAGADAEHVLAFEDPDGLNVELVAHAAAEGRAAWGGAPRIPVWWVARMRAGARVCKHRLPTLNCPRQNANLLPRPWRQLSDPRFPASPYAPISVLASGRGRCVHPRRSLGAAAGRA
jgi:catechol 2,3-dioxygenase-like lactoylglutathione lyase family enzyme